MDAVSTARLPFFSVDGQSWHRSLRTNPELTQLVSADKSRHSYIAPPNAPPYMKPALYGALLRYLQGKKVAAALDDFVLLLGKQMGARQIGYLARVNLGVDAQGTAVMLPGDIVTGIGFGFEPQDALAESLRIPSIGQGLPAVKRISYYVWYTRVPDGLHASTYTAELSKVLDERAKVEAKRRELLGEVFRKGGPNGVEQAKAAEYWQDFTRKNIAAADRRESFQKISELNARIEAAQAEFNTAYENYQTVNRELATNAAEMQTLGRIGAVLDLLKAGAGAVDAARAWRAARAQELAQRQTALKTQAEASHAGLRNAEADLKTEWQSRGVPAWAPPKIPDVPPPPSLPPPGDLYAPTSAPQVIWDPRLG